MAHIIEEYAKIAGVKIGAPEIYEDYFPLNLKNPYITMHTTSKPSKTYSYWQEVVNFIKPKLDEMNIEIVQIGGKDDRGIKGVFDLRGQTTINQTAYIIRGGLAHVGADSFPTHIASGFGKKILCLYSNNYVECVGPYWSDKDDFIAMTSYKDGKPLFALEDPERIIDKIKPEDIVHNIFKLLGEDIKTDFRTVYIGNKFLEEHVEIAPSRVAQIDDKNAPLVIRMDYVFNEQALLQQVSSHGHCYIVTNKPIDLRPIIPYKNHIRAIQYEFTKNYDIEFAEKLLKSGIPFELFCDLPEKGNEDIRLDFMDIGIVVFEDIFDYKKASEFDDVNFDNLYYKSCKILSVDDKKYYGRNSWANNDPVTNYGEWKKVRNTIDFWKEVNYSYIVEKILDK